MKKPFIILGISCLLAAIAIFLWKNTEQKIRESKQDEKPVMTISQPEIIKNENQKTAQKPKVETPKLNKKFEYQFPKDLEELKAKDFRGFREFTGQLLRKLPTNTQMAPASDGEVHHFPNSLIEFGNRLGWVKAAMEERNDFKEEGIEFYQACAREDDVISSVRALCLTNLLVFQKENKLPQEELVHYPKDVLKLVKFALEN